MKTKKILASIIATATIVSSIQVFVAQAKNMITAEAKTFSAKEAKAYAKKLKKDYLWGQRWFYLYDIDGDKKKEVFIDTSLGIRGAASCTEILNYENGKIAREPIFLDGSVVGLKKGAVLTENTFTSWDDSGQQESHDMLILYVGKNLKEKLCKDSYEKYGSKKIKVNYTKNGTTKITKAEYKKILGKYKFSKGENIKSYDVTKKNISKVFGKYIPKTKYYSLHELGFDKHGNRWGDGNSNGYAHGYFIKSIKNNTIKYRSYCFLLHDGEGPIKFKKYKTAKITKNTVFYDASYNKYRAEWAKGKNDYTGKFMKKISREKAEQKFSTWAIHCALYVKNGKVVRMGYIDPLEEL